MVGDTNQELLARVPLFSELSKSELERISQVAVPRSFPAGSRVFHEGDPGDSCYIVKGGHARAIREHPDGRSITLATFGPGDFFGEGAIFRARRRTATVTTTEPTVLFAMFGADFAKLVGDIPLLHAQIEEALDARLPVD